MRVHLISAVFNIAANDEPVIVFPIGAALLRSTDPAALRCFDIVLVFYFFYLFAGRDAQHICSCMVGGVNEMKGACLLTDIFISSPVEEAPAAVQGD